MDKPIPKSFAELVNQWHEMMDDVAFVRQLKNLEIVMEGGDMRRIQRSQGGVNAILNLGSQPTVVPLAPLVPAQPTYDPETVRWINRAAGASGTFSSTSKQIADAFIVALHAKSYNSKILWLNPLLGTNLATALVPLRDTLNVGAATNHNFLDLDFNEVTGMKSDGATKWLDIKFKPSDLSATQNGGFGVVVGGANATTDPWVIGMTNNTTQIYGLKLDPTFELFFWGDGGSDTRTGSPSGPFHYYGQRASPTDRALYKSGGVIKTNTASGVPVSAINFANAGLFSVNAGASVANATIRVAYATDGTMTAAEVADFNSLVNDHLITPRTASSSGTTIPAPTPVTDESTAADTFALIVIANDEIICANNAIVTVS